jgi:probable O-glycosylation ligase (exosortase A-associated)
MRDLLLVLIILGGSIVALRRPWIGVMLWTWISIMNPHEKFAWSAATWPVALLVAICTLIGLALTRQRQNPFLGAPVWALLAFTIWICVTLPFSVSVADSLPLWERSMKIFFMIFVTISLIDTRRKLHWFICVIVASLGFYGVKGGLFTLATGGHYIVWGPGGFIGGNNELALALVMTIPLMRYLQQQASSRWMRRVLAGCMLLTAITVLGSYSRGALLAISAMAMFMWWKAEQKVLSGLALLAISALMLPFMPDQWWDRMQTIATYDQDSSATGRINAWWMAWNLAKSHLFGGGFMVSTVDMFRIYAPVPDDVHAAHSIYFQILGEHGFIGLFIFVAIGAFMWLTARRLVRDCHQGPGQRWAAELGAMAQVSFIGYAVGGAFLSLAYFDLPYDLMAVVVLAAALVRKETMQQGILGRRNLPMGNHVSKTISA